MAKVAKDAKNAKLKRDLKEDSTILHEHRRIIAVRYLLALVNFAAILLGTLITRYFVLIRGASEGLILHINLLCIINAVQIGLCLLDYFLRNRGIYNKGVVAFSYIAGILWVLCTAGELFVGSMDLGAIRFDLLIIAGLQLVSALLAYLVWPSLDYSAVQSMTKQGDITALKRRRKARGYVARYIALCVVMILIQIGMFVAYKLPPQVYDLFSETRALEYRLNSEKNGYYVSGIYLGTSSYVNIPETYNNLPVIGINTGALKDRGFLDKYKVKTIEIGTPRQDENGNTYLSSNIKYISTGAIVNDNIIKLHLPVSVIGIEEGAFDSSSLKTVIYEAQSDFSIKYFQCANLERVTLQGDKVGNIVSLDGLKSTVTIEVSKENYNHYRRNNIEYGHSLQPILDDHQFYVDFYTDSDYYIESIFGNLGEAIVIGYQDLKNDSITDSVSPAVDTLAYIRNKHELGTNGSKAASAFRGWFYDQAMEQECIFSENGSVSFNKTTAIYAKWITEYTGELEWGGGYRPEGQPQTMYWTDEDVITFPVIKDRIGYTGGIQWYVDGNENQILDTVGISKNVTVKGTWILDKPTVDIEPAAIGDWYITSPDKNAVEFVYDEQNVLTLSAVYKHVLDDHPYNGTTTSYSLKWEKVNDLAYEDLNASVHVQNVADSGEYVLNVHVTSPYGETAVESTNIKVEINKKDLDIGTFQLVKGEHYYDSLNQTIGTTGDFADNNIKVTYTYYDEDNKVVGSNSGVMNAGRYTVRAVFEKNNAEEAANYNSQERVSEFVINPRELTFNSWSNGNLTYNGQSQSVKLNVGGILAGDDVVINYNGNSFTNAGSYTAEAISVSDPNYSLAGIVDKCRYEWKINPKEVTIKEWKLDNASTSSYSVTYNGSSHSITAVADGVYSGDTVNFLYGAGADTIRATNADTYTARIIGVDNENYTFNVDAPNAERQWTIQKKPITAVFSNVPSITYNGTQQGITATVSGIIAADLGKFTQESFLYTGKSDILAVKHQAQAANGNQLLLTFTAKDADSYTAAVSGISESAGLLYQNYVLTGAERGFSISPKQISFVNDNTYTYSGKEQSLVLKVSGIVADDLENVRLNQFEIADSSSPVVNGQVSGDQYHLILKGTNAGSYNVNVEGFDDKNYTMSAYDSSIKINKKTLTISWTLIDNTTGRSLEIYENTHVPYNYSGYKIGAEVNGLVNGETVELNFENNEQKNAASYKTKVSLASTYANYNLVSREINWVIKPYTVDFTWSFNGQGSTASVPSFVYSASAYNAVPSYTLLGDDSIELTYGQKDTSKTNVGTYNISITDLGNPNYALGNKSTLTWKITPKTVSIVWSEHNTPSSVYSGTYQGPKFSINGILESDNRFIASTVNGTEYNFTIPAISEATEYSFADAKQAVNVGTYNLIITGIKKYDEESHSYVIDPNYQVAGSSYDFDIAKRPLTLSGIWNYSNATKGTGVYENSTNLIYNAKDFTLTTDISAGLVRHLDAEADVSLVYGGNVAKNYATLGYTAQVISLSGEHAANYEVPTVNASIKWAIQKKPINFTWISNSFVYTGNAHIQNAQFQSGAATDSDGKVYAGDTVEMTYSNNSKANAGGYTATITGLSNANYSIGTGSSYQWSIAQKPISLVWTESTYVYNGAVQKPTASYTGNANVLVTEYTSTASKNVGEYTITATKLNNTNYVIDGNSTHTYTITPLTIKLSWRFAGTTTNAGDITFDKTTRTVEAYATNLCTGDTVTFTYNPGDRTVYNAGSYSFQVIDLSNNNYKLDAGTSNASKSITVAKRTVNIVWSKNTFTYDGAEHRLTPTVTGVNSNDIVGYELNTQQNCLTNVGNVTVKVTGLLDSNYALPTTNLSATLTVNPQPVAITWIGNASVTYDGAVHTLVPVVKGMNDGIILTPKITGETSRTNAGSQTITVSSLENSNYTFTGSSGNKAMSLTVNPRVVVITWSGSTNVTYDGKAHSVTAKVTGLNGAGVGFTYGSVSTTQTDAGNYTLKINSLADDNYTLAGAANVTCNFIINKQKVKITWPVSNPTYTYDGVNRELVPTIVGADDGKPVAVGSYQNGNSLTNAGSLAVTVKTLADSNYTLDGADGSVSRTIVINPQTVTITWHGSTSLVYDGQAHTRTAKVIGNVDGKDVNISYETAYSYTNAGDYTVSFRLNDNNYTLTGSTGSTSSSISIKQQPVVITWSGTENLVYDGASHTLSPTVKGANDGANVNFTYTTDKSFTNVGSHTITIKLSNSNYMLNSNSGATSKVLTITAQPVVITWAGTGSFMYDGNNHALTATVKGKNDSKTVSFKYDTTNSFTDVGSHATSITLTNSNYTMTGATGSKSNTLSITPQPVVITWTGADTVYYNGNAYNIVAKVVGKNDGRSVSFDYSSVGNAFTNAGNYQATVRELNNNNYTLSGVTNLTSPVLTINKQKVVITWSGVNPVIYNGSNHTITATVKGSIDGKDITFSYGSAVNSYKNVGNYTASVKSITNSNYTLEGVSNLTSPVLSIKPQPVKINWAGTTACTYDGKAHAITATVTGSLDGLTVSFTYDTLTRTFTNVGSYAIGIESLQNSNYTLVGVNNITSPTLEIKPQPVVITWSGTGTTVYNGNATVIQATVKGANDGQNVSFNYVENDASSRSFVNAGTYTVTVKELKNSNYVMTSDAANISPELIIKPQPVVITWSGQGTYTYRYDTSRQLTATVVGAVDGKNVSFDYVSDSYDKGYMNVGTYTRSIKALKNSNYYFAEGQKLTSPEVVIQPQTVTIEWEGVGHVTYDGKAHTISATILGVEDKQSVSFNYVDSVRSFTDVGTYTVSIKNLNNSNYILATNQNLVSPALIIDPQPVTVTWSNTSPITYDGVAHEMSATVKGSIDNEPVSFNYKAGNRSFTDAGEYTVTIISLNDKNYTIDGNGNRNGKMTILKRTVEAVWTGDESVEEDGEAHKLNATVAGFRAGTDYQVTSESHTAPGVYSYTVTLLNKNLQFVDGSTSETRQLTINQKVEAPTEDTTEAGSDPA